MNTESKSDSTLPGLAPTRYQVLESVSAAPPAASIPEAPVVRPSSLGLIDEFEQEAA